MNSIWKQPADLQLLNRLGKDNMTAHVGIEFVEIGDDYLVARMPVDHRTTQPYGILHGGASVVLAETLGSVGAALCLHDMDKETTVGVEINANHLRSVRSGFVTGRAHPLRVGRRLHVWQIEIRDDQNHLVCVSRLTVMVVPRHR